MDEDEDVVWDGSPLHQHLQGLQAEQLTTNGTSECAATLDLETRHQKGCDETAEDDFDKRLEARAEASKRQLQKLSWPEDTHNAVLEIQVAKMLITSDLLVQEDQDFVNNFVLTEEALARCEELVREREKSKSKSTLADVLLFSGSVAAVAGAVFFLSQRTKAAAAAAAALVPTALAAASTSTAASDSSNSASLEDLVKLLVEDMQMFKRLARKSLNLLQGMEMVHAGHMFAINSATGNPYTVASSRSGEDGACRSPESPSGSDAGGKLDKALADRAAFPALRKAAHECTVQLIIAYRNAVQKLMKVSPLAEHVDLRDHYIAFIDLEAFGISQSSASVKGSDISVKELKDTVQVALVQQSEYLRRFCLVFNEQCRRDEGDPGTLDKAGVLNHLQDLAATLGKINNKLSKVFEYHAAMGIDLTAEGDAEGRPAVAAAPVKQLQQDMVPLRTVYTSLFSTGLHLQNSLLKVRELEKIFDVIDARRKNSMTGEAAGMTNVTLPDQAEIIRWLRGFQAIQGELNACVGCLEEGVAQIDVLNKSEDTSPDKTKYQKSDLEEDGGISSHGNVDSENGGRSYPAPIPVIDTNNDPKEHSDEVFEAVVDDQIEVEEPTNSHPDESQEFSKQVQTERRLLRELKHVLVDKASEHEQREKAAVARMKLGSPSEPVSEKDIAALPVNQAPFKNKVEKVEEQKTATESNDVVLCQKEYSERPKYVKNSDPIISTNGDHLQTPPLNSLECKELSVINGNGEISEAKINMNNMQCPSDQVILAEEDQSRDATSVENGRMDDNHEATKGENDSVAIENSSEQSDPFICSTENPVVADCDTSVSSSNRFDDSFVVPKSGDDVSRSDSSSSSNSTSSYQTTSSSSSSSSVSDDRGTVKMCQSETFDENIASDGQIPRSVSGQVLDVDEAGDDFEDCSMATSICSESPSLAASLPPNPTTPCHRDKRRTRLSRESKAKMKALDQKDKLFGRNDSIDCQGDDEKEVSIAEIRSISTPNLKRAAALSAVASPYQTFESSPYENLDNGDENCEEVTATAASPSVEGNGYITSSSEDGSTGTGSTVESGLVQMGERGGGGGENEDISDSEWGSADELDHHVLKSYRRPLRPAALAATYPEKTKTTGRPEKASPSKSATPKRHRKLKKSHSQKSQNDCDTTTSPVMSLSGVKVADPAPATSVYLQKKLREGANGGSGAAATGISLPKNPFGFDSAMASQVASKAKLFTGFTKKKAEEVFGDSD